MEHIILKETVDGKSMGAGPPAGRPVQPDWRFEAET